MLDARPSREGSLGPFPAPKGTDDGIAISIIAHRCLVANSTVVPLQACAYLSTLIAKVPQTNANWLFQMVRDVPSVYRWASGKDTAMRGQVQEAWVVFALCEELCYNVCTS
jgi:hypothetical protein